MITKSGEEKILDYLKTTKQIIEELSSTQHLRINQRINKMTVKENARKENLASSNSNERKALLPPPQIKPREHIKMIVRDYANKNKIKFNDVYNILYKQFYYRFNKNLTLKAKKCDMTTINFAEKHGFIDDLESLAIEIFT